MALYLGFFLFAMLLMFFGWGAGSHAPGAAPRASTPKSPSTKSISDVLLKRHQSIRRHSPCSTVCRTLVSSFPGHVILGSDELPYRIWKANFWSNQQAEVDPHCIFQPENSDQISTLVGLCGETGCPFSVRSGGHASFHNASNIGAGISMDFSRMKNITLTADNKVAYIEPGNTWLEVYRALEPMGLSVIGGRTAEIGVGGLTLGGGISFFSNIYGWACDNVVSYEVVHADGTITTADVERNSDLFWALRGGGNNFGIVTKFALKVIEQGLMWGGTLTYLPSQREAILRAYTKFGFDSSDDPGAALIVATGYALGMYLTIADLEYSRPVATAPAIFEEFVRTPHIIDTTGLRSLSELAVEFDITSPHGYRDSYWTATFRLDYDLASYITQTFINKTKPLEGLEGMLPACALQVITDGVLARMSDNGGNPLGLDPAKGPYILVNLAYRWKDSRDDAAVYSSADSVIKAAVAEAKRRGLSEDYLYMNYASQYQDVIASYGEANKRRLIEVGQKYDPRGFFQRMQPGYFKFQGAPEASP